MSTLRRQTAFSPRAATVAVSFSPVGFGDELLFHVKEGRPAGAAIDVAHCCLDTAKGLLLDANHAGNGASSEVVFACIVLTEVAMAAYRSAGCEPGAIDPSEDSSMSTLDAGRTPGGAP